MHGTFSEWRSVRVLINPSERGLETEQPRWHTRGHANSYMCKPKPPLNQGDFNPSSALIEGHQDREQTLLVCISNRTIWIWLGINGLSSWLFASGLFAEAPWRVALWHSHSNPIRYDSIQSSFSHMIKSSQNATKTENERKHLTTQLKAPERTWYQARPSHRTNTFA